MNLIEFIFTISLTLWILGLACAFMFKSQNQYMVWTNKMISHIWKTAWQFIIGIAVGYFASGPWFYTSVSF